MAEIDGGSLSFKSVLDNDQLNKAVDESLKRIQGLSDGTVAGGQAMDAAFSATADSVRKALGDIGTAIQTHEQELQSLESEYQELGQKASQALTAGRDDEYRAITQKQNAVKGEITVHQQLIKELQEQSNKLEDAASKMEENKRKVEENANAHVSMRTRIKEVREEMMLLVDQGIDEQSEAYQRLKNELGRLIDIQGDVAQQGRILANDEQKYQGIIQGLSGLAGGFSAVTGTVSLFAGENEDLQKVMTKVQSVMAITIGLQQVAQTLNKDSAFQLVTINGLKKWWAEIVTKATVAETAETMATTANTAAQTANATATGAATTSQVASTVAVGAQATAAKAGTVANLGLAGAFRMVGLAIKSIPVFGWIITGITALVGLVAALTSQSRKAAKETKEMNAAIVEGSYKAIGSVQNLSSQWSALGNNLDAKKKFIEQNKKTFDELGVSIRDVADAEKLLADGAQAFIDAQIAKAKAAAVLANSEKWVKQSVEADLELERAKKKPKVTRYVSGGQFGGGGYSYEIDNPAIKKAEDKQKEANEKLQGLYADAAKYTADGLKKMEEAGIDGQDKITEGTVAWYEKQISDKQAYLKTLSVLDDTEIKTTQKQIDDFQKIIDKATGKKTTTSGGASKDQFLEKLEKQKKEYQRFMKWVNSGDEVLTKAANKEFEGLLKEGATYIDYLKNQRDVILSVDIANRTKAQNAQLRMLNDQISEETKKTVLEAFNNELSNQLNNARSIMEMLNIIEQRRKALANDGSELDNAKSETLDNAEKDISKQAQDEYKVAMQEHSDYLDSKIKADIQYINKRKELESQLKDTADPKQREVIQTQIKTLDIKHDTQNAINYDSMLAEFQSYQQKRQSMSNDFDNKIALATEKQNDDLVKRLEEAKANALSELDMNELMDSDTWNQLFGNLDNLTASKMIELRNKVESEWAKLKLSPEQLEALRNKMGEVTTKIEENNPFLALADAIKRYKAGEKNVDFKDIAKSASASIDLIKGSFDSVLGGMEKMGVTMDEQTQEVMNDISGILGGASDLAAGLASGNPLQVIQGSIGIISNGIDLIFGGHDRKAERSIKKHAEAVNRLEAAYTALSWAIDKALGSTVYKQQQSAISNMEAQREHLKAMWEAEESKKKTDRGKVNEYKDQYEQLGRDIQDMLDEISKDLLQTDAKSFADELGDALVEAFAKGEDAAEAFGETTDKIIKQAVLNQLKKNFLEKQLQGALDGLERSMGYWNGDEFVFEGLTDTEIASFKKKVASITGNFNQALGIYSDLFKDISTTESDTSLTGAVKGVSEETASLIGGQMNAMRINQLEATAIMRQQLAALSVIANNTSYNYHLAKLERIVSLLEAQSGNSLRSQGLS